MYFLKVMLNLFKEILALFAEKIVSLLVKMCENNGAFMYITGTTPDDVYMVRYFVIPRNKLLNIYVHIFLRSDRDDFHDHPWNFVTLITRGGYREEMPSEENKNHIKVNLRGRFFNAFAYRKATDLHRVILKESYSLATKDAAPMTLCITGPVIRDWGFVKDGVWMHWKKYLNLPESEEDR